MVEQPGVIRVLVNGKLRAQPFLDIRSLVQLAAASRGCSRSPSTRATRRNHRFFVYFTDKNGDVRVVEFRSNGTVGAAEAPPSRCCSSTSRTTTTTAASSQFGPDGRLYAGIGDGGSGGDPGQPRAEPELRLGKLLRLNVDKRGARWQIAGYGLRNPWRFSCDRLTHDLYIGDVGQNAWEEVDVRTPRQQRGLNNYGWRVWEGRSRYTAGQQVNPRGTLVFPLVVYSHSQGCSITGGYVYRGTVDHLCHAAATSTATTATGRSGACARRRAS